MGNPKNRPSSKDVYRSKCITRIVQAPQPVLFFLCVADSCHICCLLGALPEHAKPS
jgi:hypothetical protein